MIPLGETEKETRLLITTNLSWTGWCRPHSDHITVIAAADGSPMPVTSKIR